MIPLLKIHNVPSERPVILKSKPARFGGGLKGKIVLAFVPNMEENTPFVTWFWNPEHDAFALGHYHYTLENALEDYKNRT